MPQIMIKCPATGEELFTQIVADSLEGIGENTVRCPHCGHEHTWNGSGAYLLGI
jgi:uncharacterized Zn finger protein